MCTCTRPTQKAKGGGGGGYSNLGRPLLIHPCPGNVPEALELGTALLLPPNGDHFSEVPL